MNRQARRGIFFDLDGTLADSQSVMRGVFGKFAAEFSRDVSDDEFATLSGPPVQILVARLKRDWALPQKLTELIQFYNTLADAAFADVVAAPGATETLEAAFGQGFKVGVVTSNGSARTRLWLARQNLMRFIDIVVGGDEVCLGKPEPEPYLIALARSACARESSIAVEDSVHGARSALSAGLRTFGYAPEGRPAIDWPESVRLLGALDELIPEVTRQRFRRAVGIR